MMHTDPAFLGLYGKGMGAARLGARMGREVEAQAEYHGQTGAVRALLESDALILRGEVRARIPRGWLRAWQVDADDLRVSTPDGPLVLTMGGAEAAKWVAALNKPLPTLAEKLGIASATLWLMAEPLDEVLSAALAEANTAPADKATLGIAVLRTPADLERLLAVCAKHPALPIWAINEKGARASLPESAIRSALRAIGMVDVKACAVSATLSGTRYQRRKG
jgi:hypothetical protein